MDTDTYTYPTYTLNWTIFNKICKLPTSQQVWKVDLVIFQVLYSKLKRKKKKTTEKLRSTVNHLFSNLEVRKKVKRKNTVAWRLHFNLLPNYQKYKLRNQFCSYTFMNDGFHLAAPKRKYLLYFTCSHFQWTSNENLGHVYLIIWI